MQQYTTTFVKKEEVADNTYKYLFEKPEEFTFRAGQYAVIEIMNPKVEDERPAFRSLSMASAPHQEYLAFIMRSSDSGFKQSMQTLKAKDEITLKGPLGHMQLPSDMKIPVVFLTAGVGITPARSMLLDMHHRKSSREVTLIYSNREMKSAPCFQEMSEVALENYRCIHAITDNTSDWEGESRRIDKAFIEEYVPDITLPVFYIVGTSGFTKAMQSILAELDVQKEKIIIDNFG